MTKSNTSIAAPKKSRRKWIKRLVFAVSFLLVLWLVASYVVVYQFTRRAHPMFEEPAPTAVASTIESLRLTTADGEQIGGWFIAGDSHRPVVLLLHGNGASRAAWLRQAELVTAAGCGALLISLRAHGDSTGNFNDFGYSARHDVLAAVDWLNKQDSQRPIVIWGQSLGAAAALFAAEELGSRVSGYILECPFRDLHTAVWNRLNSRLPLGLNWLAYAGMKIVSPLAIPHADEISPLNAAAKLPASIPILVLAGSADDRAPPAESQAICDSCKNHSQLVVIQGGDHLKLLEADETTYRQAALDFIEKCQGNSPMQR